MSDPDVKPLILVASSMPDFRGVEHVLCHIDHNKFEVVRYDSYRVAHGLDTIFLKVSDSGLSALYYNDRPIELGEIRSAWYRRPNDFGLQGEPARAHTLEGQYRAMQDFLWRHIPSRSWLNNPSHMRVAGNKFVQLALAVDLGFNIPETVITNSWLALSSLPPGNLVFKMPLPGVITSTEDRVLTYSEVVSSARVAAATATGTHQPFPGMWQPYVAKRKEWRVTIVGDEVFPFAVYTSESAKDDWRRHQGKTGDVEFRMEPFPEAATSKCIRFLRELGLCYGAFDFVEEPSGELYFLELNPNGQYLWLESDPSVQGAISKAIARQLTARAETAVSQ